MKWNARESKLESSGIGSTLQALSGKKAHRPTKERKVPETEINSQVKQSLENKKEAGTYLKLLSLSRLFLSKRLC
ncbi:hypothetical protein CEF21_09845 [Bacillus sp. FJAT-42376]|nr:hypothetical protein CEF21_09845 [Bacillus sp. FJAT-42376]